MELFNACRKGSVWRGIASTSVGTGKSLVVNRIQKVTPLYDLARVGCVAGHMFGLIGWKGGVTLTDGCKRSSLVSLTPSSEISALDDTESAGPPDPRSNSCLLTRSIPVCPRSGLRHTCMRSLVSAYHQTRGTLGNSLDVNSANISSAIPHLSRLFLMSSTASCFN